MKYILLILCITLIGCEQDKDQAREQAREYMQAGMFDKAEKIYQDAILDVSYVDKIYQDEDLDDFKRLKDWDKVHLLTFYNDTEQIDKAYVYAYSLSIKTEVAFYIATETDRVANDYSMMKNHLRAMRMYNKSANLYMTYSNLHEQINCPELAISSYILAYYQAKLGEYLDEAKKYREAALNIIDSERCLSNNDVQADKEIFEL